MRVAVVGAGISGLAAAYELAKAGVDVVLYEKRDCLANHARTFTLDEFQLDLGFMGFNLVTDPDLMEFFESLGIKMERSELSFSVSWDKGKSFEWGSRNGLTGLFAQKSNAINPYFWRMIWEIIKFNKDAIKYLEVHDSNPDMVHDETLEYFVKSHGYSELLQKAYLAPICASIWSLSSEVMKFSAFSVLSFWRNQQLLQPFGRPQWQTVSCHSHDYVNKFRVHLEKKGCQIRTGCEVQCISSIDRGHCVLQTDYSEETYDACVITFRPQDALRMLGGQATSEELRILGAFQYAHSDIYLHHDKSLMPQNPAAWSACNFLGSPGNGACLTYWLNVLQNIDCSSLPLLLTINPPHIPEHNVLKWRNRYLIPSVAASKASLELDKIQGRRGMWFCGGYQGYGFHEDRLKAGIVAAHKMLGKESTLLRNHKSMVPSLAESGARLVVTKFLQHYIMTGSLTLLEEGGRAFIFNGTSKKSCLKSVVKVHNPDFYWKIATQADIGLADAYIDGHFSFENKQEGLLDLLMIFIANRDLRKSSSKDINIRGWSPILLAMRVASAMYFIRHMFRQNTLTQARRNISRHYDLSNDFFSLFLDETMTYSSGIFKMENEELKVAQLRKTSLLIEKARIDKGHEILDIGCGWGSLAIEVVNQTGCRYTGITLSEEQLQFAKRRVKEAGLEDHITFLLCDYRQLSPSHKYNRIISCEMIEHVGHEYMEEFFGCCDSLLAEDGLFILQSISIPDERYDEFRRSSDFMKEYIFPGGNLPCLSRITSAMAAATRLCVEHLENIGIHYYQTLRCWRNNLMANKSEILSLGFDEKFIRTWEYYFIYCAAGFKSRTLGDYQIVFSRPGNLKAFSDPYRGFPSIH